MFKRVVLKYGRLMYTITGKEKVFPLFLEDVTHCKPTNIVEYKTRIVVVYRDEKYTTQYIVPIAYKKYIRAEE